MDNFYELFIQGKLNWSNREVIVIIAILTTAAVTLFVLIGCKDKAGNGRKVTAWGGHGKICVRQAIAIYFLIVFLCMVYSYCVFSRLPQSKPMYNLEPFWSWKRVLRVLQETSKDKLRVYSLLKEGLNESGMTGTIGAAGSPSYLFVEIILNLILLLPVGFLLPFIMSDSIVLENRLHIVEKKVNKSKGRRISRQLCQPCVFHPYITIIIVSVVCTFCLSLSIEILQLLTRRGLFEWDDIIGNVIGGTIGGIIGMTVRRIWGKYRKSSVNK